MSKQDSRAPSTQPGGLEISEAVERELAGWPDALNRLREAMSQNELVLYGQPIVELESGHTEMVEALVRLREEETALLPPGDFLPAFEHYRMMPELDRWVLGRAVAQLVHGTRIPRITINVAGQSLAVPGFAKFIAEATVASALPASRLVFEIDESSVLSQLEQAARFAASVKTLGCGVLIDGFGARGVSFAPLKLLRVDFLKVDGRIVRNILRSPVAQTKLHAIVRVSRTLGFDLIAEGIEEPEVLAAVKALGVRYAQGYGISPPQRMESLLSTPGSRGDARVSS